MPLVGLTSHGDSEGDALVDDAVDRHAGENHGPVRVDDRLGQCGGWKAHHVAVDAGFSRLIRGALFDCLAKRSPCRMRIVGVVDPAENCIDH